MTVTQKILALTIAIASVTAATPKISQADAIQITGYEIDRADVIVRRHKAGHPYHWINKRKVTGSVSIHSNQDIAAGSVEVCMLLPNSQCPALQIQQNDGSLTDSQSFVLPSDIDTTQVFTLQISDELATALYELGLNRERPLKVAIRATLKDSGIEISSLETDFWIYPPPSRKSKRNLTSAKSLIRTVPRYRSGVTTNTCIFRDLRFDTESSEHFGRRSFVFSSLYNFSALNNLKVDMNHFSRSNAFYGVEPCARNVRASIFSDSGYRFYLDTTDSSLCEGSTRCAQAEATIEVEGLHYPKYTPSSRAHGDIVYTTRTRAGSPMTIRIPYSVTPTLSTQTLQHTQFISVEHKRIDYLMRGFSFAASRPKYPISLFFNTDAFVGFQLETSITENNDMILNHETFHDAGLPLGIQRGAADNASYTYYTPAADTTNGPISLSQVLNTGGAFIGFDLRSDSLVPTLNRLIRFESWRPIGSVNVSGEVVKNFPYSRTTTRDTFGFGQDYNLRNVNHDKLEQHLSPGTIDYSGTFIPDTDPGVSDPTPTPTP